MIRAQPSRPVAAVVVALSLHAAAAAAILLGSSRPDPATDQGTGGTMMLIAATAAGSFAGSGRPQEQAPSVPDTEQLPTATAPEPETQSVQPQKPPARIKAEKRPRLEPVVQARDSRQVKRPPPKPVPVPRRKPAVPQTVVHNHPPATSQRALQHAKPTGGAVQKTATDSPAAKSGDGGHARQTQIAKSGGGEISIHGDYLAVVRDWLHEHKRYPRRARLRMLQGKAIIGFVIDRSGNVVSYELRDSTGHDVLDREVIAMIRRASPMPPFPQGIAKKQMRFNVPVSFDMR